MLMETLISWRVDKHRLQIDFRAHCLLGMPNGNCRVRDQRNNAKTSNRGPSDLQSDALPTELSRLVTSDYFIPIKCFCIPSKCLYIYQGQFLARSVLYKGKSPLQSDLLHKETHYTNKFMIRTFLIKGNPS